jgi:ubiquinone/menaquinone biosynthesis C-methylase UbiE
MSDNAQQIEYWNGPAGQRWAALQETTDRNLSAISSALMKFVAAKPGERVLDIGCGAGTTTQQLAEAVGPSGKVTGVDISQPMLGAARSRTKATNVEYIEADASKYDFKPGFTLAFSRFGVMFFADPVTAFTNIRESLDAGGRLAFVCWRAMQENTWAAAPFAAALELLPKQEPMDPHAPGPFAFADQQRLMNIFMKAGFAEFKGEKLDTVMNMGASLDDAVAASLSIGPLARATAEVDEPTRGKIAQRVRDTLGKFETASGITPPAACWLVEAKA